MQKNQFSHLRVPAMQLSVFFVFLFLFAFVYDAHAVTRPSVTINGGARSTNSERVNLSLVLPKRAERMRIANSRRELATATWRKAKESFSGWYLPKRSGDQFVYVDFELRDGSHDGTYSDGIVVNVREFDGKNLVINDDEAVTASRRVRLNISIPENALRMRISSDVDIADAQWRVPRNEWFWTLDKGSGKRTLYLQFQYRDGRISNIFQDDIRLIEPMKVQVGASINRGIAKTFTRDVVVSLSYSYGIKEVRLSNSPSFTNVKWLPAEHLIPWKLTEGNGKKVVQVQFKDLNDQVTAAAAGIQLEELTAVSHDDSPSEISRLPVRSIVKGPGPGVYYVGVDQKLHPFQSSKIFYSWFTNFASLKFVSGAEIAKHAIGSPICVRAGTWLVKFGNLPEIYAVEQGCRLRPLRSEVEAFLIYGGQWQNRVISLPATGQGNYTFVRLSATNNFTNTVDADADGIDKELEESLGTSDSNRDTDGDKLSDYEEFYWWFTDPKVRDTDGDGMGDGDEILNLRSPTGDSTIHTIASDTYTYPNGQVFRHLNQRYYFKAVPEGPLYVGWRSSDKRFTSNSFQERFVAASPVNIPFDTRVRSLAENVVAIEYPTIMRDNNIVPL